MAVTDVPLSFSPMIVVITRRVLRQIAAGAIGTLAYAKTQLTHKQIWINFLVLSNSAYFQSMMDTDIRRDATSKS